MSYDEQRFSATIDDVLRSSDLNTISAKRIRKALSARFGYDVNEYKVRSVNRTFDPDYLF